ncbi:ubiquinone biosynthesis protein COQ9-B, mitochondrial [Cocos nucifera]|uniref:Ubiquinone biosynthesis protein n=1 Tax=Cocos nucifera TaxID=13894 RepID=A0A8K0IT24_COCNU|nr:ubiquinone biosynthesis protein COQ9-B, mitochondrial [Cocos nucifera]
MPTPNGRYPRSHSTFSWPFRRTDTAVAIVYLSNMLRSVAARRLLTHFVSPGRSAAAPALRRLSTPASPQPNQPHTSSEQLQGEHPNPTHGASASSRATGEDGEPHLRRGGAGPRARGDYEEEQARVLRAAVPHVVRFGWSESALIAGARDVGLSPSIVGSFPRKEAALVEFFMDDCLQRLIDRIDSGEELKDLILSDRLSKLIRIRLEMQAPYISKWPQALSIQAQPVNLPTSFKQRALLVDEIWHAAGDTGSDIDWYVKRTVLGDFRDTWKFLGHRIKDAFDLQKTVKEAAYLAEAVAAGMGNSVQGAMRRLFQG